MNEKEFLRSKQLRPTRQRVIVLKHMWGMPVNDTTAPLSLHKRISGDLGKVSVASVYNILKKFEERGLVCSEQMKSSRWKII